MTPNWIQPADPFASFMQGMQFRNQMRNQNAAREEAAARLQMAQQSLLANAMRQRQQEAMQQAQIEQRKSAAEELAKYRNSILQQKAKADEDEFVLKTIEESRKGREATTKNLDAAERKWAAQRLQSQKLDLDAAKIAAQLHPAEKPAKDYGAVEKQEIAEGVLAVSRKGSPGLHIVNVKTGGKDLTASQSLSLRLKLPTLLKSLSSMEANGQTNTPAYLKTTELVDEIGKVVAPKPASVPTTANPIGLPTNAPSSRFKIIE